MPRVLPGNYDLNALVIYAENGRSIDIQPVFTEIHIFESILSPCVTGYVTVTDALNLISGVDSALPIMGNEIILIEFVLPSYYYYDSKTSSWVDAGDNVIKFIGRVTDIKNRVLLNDRSQNYEIHFASEDLVIDRNHRINKSYPKKTNWEVAKSILDNELKPLCSYQIEKTVSPANTIIPGWSPIQALNWLATRSISQRYGTSTYFFFQTLYHDGDISNSDSSFDVKTRDDYASKYWFVSLDFLLDWDARKTIFFSPSNTMAQRITLDPESYMSFSNAQNYEIVKSFDMLESITNGLYAGRHISHDQVKKSWAYNDYNYVTNFNRYKHLDKAKLYNGAPNVHGLRATDYVQPLKTVHSSGTPESPSTLPKIAGERLSRLSSLNHFHLHILVPGDGLLESGDVIDFKLPSPEPGAEAPKYDSFYEGKYLITAIRHVFRRAPNDYTLTLECRKETLKQEVSEFQ